jgi:vacuolar-type H+-ATPase subunit H
MAGKVETLQKIKDAETEAARIEEQAKAQARKVLADAEAAANATVADARKAADAAYAEAVAKAQAEVQKERAALAKRGEERAKRIRAKADGPEFKQAVDTIVQTFEKKLGK